MGLHPALPWRYRGLQDSKPGNSDRAQGYCASTEVIAVNFSGEGDYNALTKGDNNEVNDRGLYEPRQLWLNKKHIMGRIRGFLPYIGILTILLNDYPYLKWSVLGLMGLMVLVSKDPQDV